MTVVNTNVQTALNVVTSLQNRSNFVSVKTLASEFGVTVPVLRQVVKSLTKSGLLVSSRGRTGGVKLNVARVVSSTTSDFRQLVTDALETA
jgi:DNA-binding IscR family transcriptional regulator